MVTLYFKGLKQTVFLEVLKVDGYSPNLAISS
jgi:hypothetical protein